MGKCALFLETHGLSISESQFLNIFLITVHLKHGCIDFSVKENCFRYTELAIPRGTPAPSSDLDGRSWMAQGLKLGAPR